jgi:hypothetical protein
VSTKERGVTPQEVWRAKSDQEVVAASKRIEEYTAQGQQIIIAELHRRQQLGLISDTMTADAPVVADLDDADHTNLRAPTGIASALWYGHVPLRKTYWVCGVLTSSLWRVFIGIADAAGVVPLVLLLVLSNLIYLVFIMVAIWRSAGRYQGNRLWADLARVSIAIGLAMSVANLLLR